MSISMKCWYCCIIISLTSKILPTSLMPKYTHIPATRDYSISLALDPCHWQFPTHILFSIEVMVMVFCNEIFYQITAHICTGIIMRCVQAVTLTHWDWVKHICISRWTIIGSDNRLSPGRCQAIIWTNAGILLIRPLGTNFNEMFIEILTFSFMKMHLKVSSANGVHFVSASMC